MVNRTFCLFFIISIFQCLSLPLYAQSKDSKGVFRVMEYNVENLFDCVHDTLKQDYEFSKSGSYNWTPSKYWRKLNSVARAIVLASTHDDRLVAPDLVGLCEVENDSVLHSLCHRSLLRGAGYEYLMTNSPDARGIDVALLYQPFTFRPLSHYSLRVDTLPGMHPTRDILYVKGETLFGILHTFVVHTPSRRGGERATRNYRLQALRRLVSSIDSIRSCEENPRLLVMGDFNAYTGDASINYLTSQGMTDVTCQNFITKNPDVRGTYRYRGEWGSLDHVFVSEAMLRHFLSSAIAAHPELLEDDETYGGVKPRRYFKGPVAVGGYSDHLPLVVEFQY